jgi:hypothetical protein
MRFRRETAECASAQAKHRDLPCRHVLALRRSARSEHGKEHVGLGGSSRENGKSVLDLPFSEWIHSQVRHAPKDGVQLTVAADVFMDNSGNFPEGSSDWADSVHWRREEKRREEKRGSADIFRRIDGIARRENFKGMESGPTEMVDPLQKGWIFLQGVFTY